MVSARQSQAEGAQSSMTLTLINVTGTQTAQGDFELMLYIADLNDKL
jgi:hypothetical protein